MSNSKERFFLVEDEYEILRFSGESAKEDKTGIENILKYYKNSGLTEELLRENSNKYNLDKMLQIVKEHFIKEYEYNGRGIVLSNCYQRSVNSYIFLDDERNPFIHIDELFESSIMSFFLIIFKWSKRFNNPEVYGNCFTYLLFIINEISIWGNIPNKESHEALMQIIDGDVQIMNLASSCYWTVVIFSLAHEVAHSYFKSIGKKFRNRKQEEFEADKVAYDTVLKTIINHQDSKEKNKVVEDYTYLAPVMYMQFFDLLYYTNRVLYNKMITTETHPLPKERIGHLFAIANDNVYNFSTTNGNHLYNGFLDVYDEYRTQLLLKKERGKLDRIIQIERGINEPKTS